MKNIKFWFNNARPISLPQSMLPALTAVALSYSKAAGSEFSWIAAVASVFGVMFLHLGMNLLDASAILLSQFTDNYRELLVGVNIGGAGTLIASLASLITFREYTKNNPGKNAKYIALFSLFNFGILAILTIVMLIVM